MEVEKEIDIEELEAILGLENKTSEINALFSKQESPKSFLQAISIISNSGQFGDNQPDQRDDSSSPTSPTQNADIENLVKNAVKFFSSENTDKLKIDFTKPVKEAPPEDMEIIIQETKDINNQNKNQIGNKNKKNPNTNNNNNINNNNNQKDEKEKIKKNKNKKKKKKDEKKNENKDDNNVNIEIILEEDTITNTNTNNANTNLAEGNNNQIILDFFSKE